VAKPESTSCKRGNVRDGLELALDKRGLDQGHADALGGQLPAQTLGQAVHGEPCGKHQRAANVCCALSAQKARLSGPSDQCVQRTSGRLRKEA